MICPICKTDNGENPKNCSNCGWEFVYFLTEPSEIEIENYKLKVELAKLKYEQQQTPPPQKKDENPQPTIQTLPTPPQKKDDDTWIDRLIEWADKYNIPQDNFPRDRKKITNLTELDLYKNQNLKLTQQ